MDNTQPRCIPIHRSLNRPHLILGAERSLVLCAGLITAMLIFSGSISLWSIASGVIFWCVAFWVLIQMAKADTQMSSVYQRHIRYRAYYTSHGCLHARLSPLPKSKG